MMIRFHPCLRSTFRGIVLIDALVAILIFSFGILGLLAVQANAVRLSTDAKYRTDAALQADRLIAQMWMANQQTLATAFKGDGTTNGAAYSAWAKEVDCTTAAAATSCLPGVTANPPLVTVSDAGLVTITVRWRGPNEEAGVVHQYVSVTQIDRK